MPSQWAPSQWSIAGWSLMARRYVLAGWRPYDSRAIKRRQYFVSKYGSSIYIKPLFSLLLSMLVHVYSSDFLFSSAF